MAARPLARTCLAAACLLAAPAARAERSLYGQQPKRDAIFVRVVNALDTEVSVTSDLLPPQTIGIRDESRIGSYLNLDRTDASSLPLVVRAGGQEVRSTVGLSPATKVSLVVRRDGEAIRVVAMASRYEMNQTRTSLSFVNAAPECGPSSLRLEPASTVVFPDVAVDTERSRGVNPVSVQLSSGCREGRSTTAKPVQLEAGNATSVWLLVLGSQPTLIVGSDALPAWKP
ncbi:hypothetical protein NS228_09535 [Methylobacterium indicum]|uniref:alginate O-acetyltransferase AlgF n=1 Tax=Methylobacterium indicum TaxID=1775910 RepID=UPI00073427EE|nr:alginate O-acetyltransferase AlgF [Methylobacterium indicum]KTS38491.1 hypothetical protein NS229_03475 [Methylobacterium indicum]KTS40758.1 hypothetical protein NS228_09535 [Methylobacterium indicum]KTS53883.1 hypothetical protein NS230_03730 [Methylobacterium indicum]